MTLALAQYLTEVFGREHVYRLEDAVFCANGAMEIGRVIRHAKELMRDDSGR